MIVFRNAVQVVICDGCYSVISKPGSAPVERLTAWHTIDGRTGHVCSTECGAKFEADKPNQERVA
jgi:hypothetical protein